MKIDRLKKSADFVRVGKSGKKVGTKSFLLLAAENDVKAIRVGYTVSKKVSKLAVERNRIKRRLRAAVKDMVSEKGKPGHDYVIIGRVAVLKLEYADIVKDMKYALKKLEV